MERKKKAREAAIIAFEAVNELLFAQLRTKDPDVFFETQSALEMLQHNINYFGHMPYKNIGQNRLKAPFIEYVSPGDVIQSVFGVSDAELFGSVINPAMKLYHCELGGDCTPEGEWNPHICHLGYGSFQEAACEYDLANFYQNHFLSPNQWQDVQSVLQVIRSLYE